MADVDFSIGADDSKMTAALGRVKSEVSSTCTSVNSSLNNLAGGFQRVQSGFLAITAVVAGGAALKGAISASSEWTGECSKLAKALGTTTEQASVLNVALSRAGIESDQYLGAASKLSAKIGEQPEVFDKLGVSLKDATGNFRPMGEVLTDVTGRLGQIKNPVEQNIAGIKLFGEEWSSLKGILKLNADAMAAAEQRAKDLGLIVGAEGAAQAAQYKAQLKDLNLVAKSLEIQFGSALLPVFAKTGSFLAQEGPAAGKTFARVLETVGFAAGATWLTLKDMGDGIGALAAQGAALLRGDLAGYKAIGAARDAEAAKNEAAFNKLKANLYQDAPKPPPVAPDFSGGLHVDLSNKKDKDPKAADKSRMTEWEVELGNQKSAYQQMTAADGSYREMTLQQELAFWQTKEKQVKSGSAEAVALKKKEADLLIQIQRQQHEQEVQIDAIRANSAVQAALARVDAEEAAAQHAKAMKTQTDEELLTAESGFEQRRYEIKRQALQDRLALAQKDPDKNAVEAARINAEIEALEREHASKMRAIQFKQEEGENKGGFGQFSQDAVSAMSGALGGITTQWTNMQGVVTGVFKSIYQSFLKNMVTDPLAQMAMRFVRESALYQALAGVQVATQAGASTTVAATKAVEATAVVGANAAEGATGAAAAVAPIPIVGPGLAAAAFAGTMALLMGATGSIKSARGGYDIPAGLNPVTQLHEQEMVLPKEQANAVRDMAAGRAGGGGVSLSVKAFDSRDVVRALGRNGALTKALRNANRNFSKG